MALSVDANGSPVADRLYFNKTAAAVGSVSWTTADAPHAHTPKQLRKQAKELDKAAKAKRRADREKARQAAEGLWNRQIAQETYRDIAQYGACEEDRIAAADRLAPWTVGV